MDRGRSIFFGREMPCLSASRGGERGGGGARSNPAGVFALDPGATVSGSSMAAV